MFLKSIKLAGFKSFVDPTLITANPRVNAIVGPNGCGKSNIVDAIRWVIGEISAKQLRGQSMSDVIFAGSKQRKPVGKAMVELIFDNTDARIGGEYGAYSDISVRREVSRDGGSTYYVNGVQSRRRDVLDLLSGTGLGSGSYSIIGQGTVSRLVEAKPEDTRAHIEELGGIAKYRLRREETQRRMNRTDENLERMNDLRGEIDKQVRHLTKQAETAESYQTYQAQQVRLQAEVKSLEWHILSESVETKNAAILERKVKRETHQETLRDIEQGEEALMQAQEVANAKHQEAQRQLYEINAAVTELERQIKEGRTKFEANQERREEVHVRHAELQDDLLESADQIESLEAIKAAIEPDLESVSDTEEQAKASLALAKEKQRTWQRDWDQYQKNRMQAHGSLARTKAAVDHATVVLKESEEQAEASSQRLASFDQTALNSQVTPFESALEKAQSFLQLISEKQATLSKSIQDTRQANTNHEKTLRSNQQSLNRMQASLAAEEARQHALLNQESDDVLAWLNDRQLDSAPRLGASVSAKPGWELAVETVLRYCMQAICVSDLETYLKQDALPSGQVMLVENKVRPSHSSKPSLALQVDANCAVSAWLSIVYTASSLSEAKAMLPTLAAHESVITQEGHWLGPGWYCFSQPGDDQDSILQRKKRIAELTTDVAKADKMGEQDLTQQTQGRETLERLEKERDSLQFDYHEALQKHREADKTLSQEVARIAEAKREWERCERDRHQNSARVEQHSQTLQDAKQSVVDMQAQHTAYEAQRQDWDRQREEHQHALSVAQTVAAQASQRAEELAVRMTACEEQLALLAHTRERNLRHESSLASEEEMLTSSIEDIEINLPDWEQSLQERLKNQQTSDQALAILQEKLQAERQSMNEYVTKRRSTQSVLDDLNSELTSMQMAYQDVLTRQEALTLFCEEHAINTAEVLASLTEEVDLKASQQELTQVEKCLAALGPINLAAIDEVQMARERQAYLDKQHNDLAESLRILQEAIDTIDNETRELFKQTYMKVKEAFQVLFPRIFRGGSATLETTSDDWLTTGIQIKAQPPGKRNTSIHLLSGGEKALTAMALVFAMFQQNPAPFCILDEVDAPLDDLNVSRFCDLVQTMANNTQFFMISHNKLTIQMADQMMGITMQEPGVSRIVSVDMAQAIEMAGETA